MIWLKKILYIDSINEEQVAHLNALKAVKPLYITLGKLLTSFGQCCPFYSEGSNSTHFAKQNY